MYQVLLFKLSRHLCKGSIELRTFPWPYEMFLFWNSWLTLTFIIPSPPLCIFKNVWLYGCTGTENRYFRANENNGRTKSWNLFLSEGWTTRSLWCNNSSGFLNWDFFNLHRQETKLRKVDQPEVSSLPNR